jgi:hypothetical protein
MLWSLWAPKHVKAGESPKRFDVYTTRAGAANAMRIGRDDRGYQVVVLNLRIAEQPVQGKRGVEVIYSAVAEFPPTSVGDQWSLPASVNGDHFVVRGDVPAVLWHVEARR